MAANAQGPRWRLSEVPLEALTPPPWLRWAPEASRDRGAELEARGRGVAASGRPDGEPRPSGTEASRLGEGHVSPAIELGPHAAVASAGRTRSGPEGAGQPRAGAGPNRLPPPPGASQPSAPAVVGPGKPKLLDKVRNALRLRHYSDCTEKAYVQWIRRFIFFHGVRHPAEMGKDQVAAFLSHLASDRHVAASTQNQALCALIFLYATVLGMDIGIIEGILRAKRPHRLPVVLTPEEIREIFRFLEGEVLLLCRILYGSGMRLLEGLRMRVKDVDFARHEITVRSGKGEKDRVTMLPTTCADAPRAHLGRVRELHHADLARGLGRAALPYALAHKYREADREWVWQYVFPASGYYRDRVSGLDHRHHLHETVIQREVKAAVRAAGVNKPATPHVFRHAFATELIRAGYDIRTVQELLGHSDINTTMIYVHVLNRGGRGVQSPADRL